MDYDFISTSDQHRQNKDSLRAILPYFNNIQFYRNKIGKSYEFGKDLEGFSKIAFTTKEDLRSVNPLIDRGFPIQNYHFIFSSGTTGLPTIYAWTENDTKILSDVAGRAMRRIGVSLEDLGLIVAPLGLPIMWFCMMHQYLAVNAGVIPLGVTDPYQILNILKTLRPTMMATVPNAVLRLFEFKEQFYEKEFQSSIRHFHVGGEFLCEARRTRIENHWNAQCFDFYGLSEIFGPIAGECPAKDGMHLASDYVFIEVLDPITKQTVSNGEAGVAVYTTLWQKGAPVLRYWSEDLVMIDYTPCSCGRTSPRIFYRGRIKDSFLLEGTRYFAKDIENILLSQIYIGNEWDLTLQQSKKVNTISIRFEGVHLSVNENNNLIQLLRLYFQTEIEIELFLLPVGSFSRTSMKPIRIIDQR